MHVLFTAMICISNLVAFGIMLTFFIAVVRNKQEFLTDAMLADCTSYLNLCFVSECIFILASWIFITGSSGDDYENKYINLARGCSGLSFLWLLFFFSNILVGIYARYKSVPQGIKILKKLRPKCLINAFILLSCAFLINPNGL